MKKLLMIVAMAGVIAMAGTAHAALITYVGSDVDLAEYWRTLPPGSPAKSLDADGDNVYGTDGYFLFATNAGPAHLQGFWWGADYDAPDYVTGLTGWAYSAGGYYGDTPIDNGSQPPSAAVSNIQPGTGYLFLDEGVSGSLMTFTVQDPVPVNGFRVGIYVDVQGGTTTPSVLDLGGTAMSPDVGTNAVPGVHGNGALDMHLFDVTGAAAGDVLTLIIESSGRYDSSGISGITFDTLPVPEPAGLGPIGLALLAVRKRRS